MASGSTKIEIEVTVRIDYGEVGNTLTMVRDDAIALRDALIAAFPLDTPRINLHTTPIGYPPGTRPRAGIHTHTVNCKCDGRSVVPGPNGQAVSCDGEPSARERKSAGAIFGLGQW